jgi:hypothetical protein
VSGKNINYLMEKHAIIEVNSNGKEDFSREIRVFVLYQGINKDTGTGLCIRINHYLTI